MTPKSSKRFLNSKFAWSTTFFGLILCAGLITVTLRGVDIFGLVAAATSSLQVPATLYLVQYDDIDMKVGDIKKLDISVNARVPINAVGATVKFPEDSVEILGFSKEKSFFDLWTEETAINEDEGEIHFSGGTTHTGGITGTGTVLTLTLRAKKPGTQNIFFKDSQIYSADGKGTMLDNDTRSLLLDVLPQPKPAIAVVASAPTKVVMSAQPETPLPKKADLNNDGAVNLIDMSIMILHLMMAPYDQRFDLNMDGNVNISDLSILLSQVR